MDEAVRDLHFALDIEPQAPLTLYYLGAAYARMDNTAVALEYYEKALALKPDFDEVYEAKAELLAQLGRREDALVAIDKAIQYAEVNPAYYYSAKGKLLEKFEDWRGALDCFIRASEEQPKQSSVWMDIYRMAEKVGNKERAQSALRTYLQLCPMDEAAKKLLAP
jgi:protein O-GlcNAc transferase